MFAATFEAQGGLHSHGWASSLLSLAFGSVDSFADCKVLCFPFFKLLFELQNK